VLWLGGELSDQFSGLIQAMAAAFGFCAVKNGGGQHITIAQIRKSLESGLRSCSKVSPDLHFLLLVLTAIFANFSIVLI